MRLLQHCSQCNAENGSRFDLNGTDTTSHILHSGRIKDILFFTSRLLLVRRCEQYTWRACRRSGIAQTANEESQCELSIDFEAYDTAPWCCNRRVALALCLTASNCRHKFSARFFRKIRVSITFYSALTLYFWHFCSPSVFEGTSEWYFWRRA